jgi:hypothetical protein
MIGQYSPTGLRQPLSADEMPYPFPQEYFDASVGLKIFIVDLSTTRLTPTSADI